MISISMTTRDLGGSVVINDSSKCDFGEIPARVSRTATLDGGCYIGHSGIVEGDRTFQLSCQISADQKTTVDYIHENSTSVLISCSEGLFLGTFSTINTQNGQLKATFLVKSKEN